jgi:hypothetical protein
MNAGTQDYLGVVRQLPRPTVAQTERFARYVSSAHSWYKHLPVDPKVPFVFYLDPGAGMSLVQTQGGETALVEITDESTRFHYTWQKTEDYRRRFGHWNYHADYGTSFMFAGEGGMVSTADPGLNVLTESGDWVRVPPDLATKGTALLSAFVHPCPNLHIWANNLARFGLSGMPDADDTRFLPPGNPVLGRLWSVLQQNKRAGPDLTVVGKAIPAQALELLKRSVAKRPAALWFWPTERGWDWPGEPLLEQLQALGVGASVLSAVVKCTEVEWMRTPAASMNQASTHESPEWPAEAMLALTGEILEERGRQLAAMTDAMGRFIEAVFP